MRYLSAMQPRKVRPPKQQRSIDSWNRLLDAGVGLLLEQGRDALTITSVCRRARVPPVTLYARVDDMSGLFWAIYDREMVHVAATYAALLEKAAATRAGTPARTRAVVSAVCETFRRHEAFLHQIINISVADADLRERGSRESLALVGRIAGLLPARTPSAGWSVARMLHQECVFRAMYGDRWLSNAPEGYAAFRSRLQEMALARLAWRPRG